MPDLSNITNYTPYYIIIAACIIFSAIGLYKILRDDDEAEWQESRLRRSPPATSERDTFTDDRAIGNRKPNPKQPKEYSRGKFQKFAEFPLIQPWFSLGLGFFAPGLIILAIGLDFIEDTRYELFVFYGFLLAWNYLFILIFKFPLRFPILPIPLTWIGVPLFLIGLWDMVFWEGPN